MTTTQSTRTSPTAAATAAPDTATARIAGARQRIDDLDARIVALIKERMSASDEIQQIRITDGGRRVDLAREMDILRHYGDALGRERGTRLAMTLLELCRGAGGR
ncbi:chorismate mutase [Streptomyces xiamenensis]|jgi:chorismate mutase|uniref:chorismate mutase n=1 Tax=Streptomyces xiamenensis TaxID=408015 RepID=UPI003420A5DD